MAPPKRRRPAWSSRSSSGSFWREYMLAMRGHCFARRIPPASRPRKCGARRMMRWPARVCRCSRPSSWTSASTRWGADHHRMPRSMKLRRKARKWARAIASRFSSLQRGKHLARLTRVTLRRSGMSQNTTDPIAAPIAATARNGRKRTSHMNPMKPPPSSRLSTTRASGHFVAVVAPEVLAGTFAHEILERAVEPPGRGFARELFRKGLQPDLVAAAPWQPSPEGEKAAYAFALREPGGEGHGVRRTAEEIGPVAFAFAGHLVGQKADRLAVAQRLEDRAHPAHVGGHEAHVRPVAPFP